MPTEHKRRGYHRPGNPSPRTSSTYPKTRRSGETDATSNRAPDHQREIGPPPAASVVNRSIETGSAEHIYETLYCAREQAENLITLHKAQLASDHTSCRS